MTRYDALIIGGGINGIVAGATLAKHGKKVCIVERADGLGGMATMRVGDGPELAQTLHNLSPKVIQDLGITDQIQSVLSQPLPTVALCNDGRHIVCRGRDISWIDGVPHPDADTWNALQGQLIQYGDLLRQLGEAPPPGGGHALLSRPGLAQMKRLAKLGLGLKRMGKTEMRRFLQVLLSNAHDLILDDMPDGPLAGLIAADAVRGTAAGPRSPGTVFNLIYRLGHGGTVTHPKGGMSALIDILTKAATDLGCNILNNTDVARIEIADDTVTGLTTADGQILSAPLILCSLAPKHIARLAGTANFDIEATRRIRNIRARGTVAKVNFKLDSDAPLDGLLGDLSDARLIYAPSSDYVERAFNPAKYGQMAEHPVIEAIKTKTQDGSQWLSANVQYAPSDLDGEWTDASRDRLAGIARDTLCRTLPDLSRRIVDTQVITPDQIESATGAPGGHWHHAEMSLDQVLTIRPANGLSRHAIGPKGLFLCGASAHPGGDVMGLAGRNAALAAMEAKL